MKELSEDEKMLIVRTVRTRVEDLEFESIFDDYCYQSLGELAHEIVYSDQFYKCIDADDRWTRIDFIQTEIENALRRCKEIRYGWLGDVKVPNYSEGGTGRMQPKLRLDQMDMIPWWELK